VQQLVESNRAVRLRRAKALLKIYKDDRVDFIWLVDEKLFMMATDESEQMSHSVRSDNSQEEAGRS